MSRSVWVVTLALCATACGSESSDNGDGTILVPGGDMAGAQPGQNDAPGATPGGTAGMGSVTTPGDTNTPGGMADDPAGMAGDDAAGDDSPGQVTGDCGEPSLELEGLMYSPGGNILPKGCEPYDATLNNPYAVRCIDAWSWYQTQFPGDELCILPPPPDKGIQFGVHPQGMDWYAQVSQGDLSGYDNVGSDFLMDPGQEEEMNYLTGSGNQELRNFYRNNVRMRAGSHHMIVSGADPGLQREAWGPGAPVGLFGGVGLPGAQRVDENTPKTLDKPEEDAGLYKALPPDRDVTFNMHHFNSTDSVILKETWTNLWWEEDARIEVFGIFGMPLTQALDTFAQPGQTTNKHYSWNISQDVRLVTVFGHRHAWTPNFSAWVEKPGGDNELIYQSFDWFDQPTYRYDSVVQNPAPAPDLRADGATTGVRILKAGEQLHFNCHVTFTPERAASEGAPTPAEIGTLRFANQAFAGEMCILFGSTAGIELPQPSASSSALPDFATLD